MMTGEKGSSISCELFEDAFAGAKASLIITDALAKDNPIIYANQAFYDLTGYTEEEVIGKNCRFLQGKDTDPDRVDRIRKAVKQRRAIEVLLKNYKKDGSAFWNQLMVTPIKTKGRVTHFLGMQLDVTHSVESGILAKQEEARLNRVLEEQHALVELSDAKDEFISLASHQLRTPATGVKQFVGMLLEDYFGNLTDDQRTILEYAYESNERQLQVINDLLKVAQVDAGKVVLTKTRCDLAELLEDIMQEQRSQFAARKQRVVLDRPDEPVYANIDATRIRMVAENLIDNASKYTPENKRIIVSINLVSSGKKAEIKVKDEGVGIAQEDITKLFHKFSRLDNPLSIQVGGTGIGLYWAKKIVDLHDGTIDIKSKPGKGTTFIVRIPT